MLRANRNRKRPPDRQRLDNMRIFVCQPAVRSTERYGFCVSAFQTVGSWLLLKPVAAKKNNGTPKARMIKYSLNFLKNMDATFPA